VTVDGEEALSVPDLREAGVDVDVGPPTGSAQEPFAAKVSTDIHEQIRGLRWLAVQQFALGIDQRSRGGEPEMLDDLGEVGDRFIGRLFDLLDEARLEAECAKAEHVGEAHPCLAPVARLVGDHARDEDAGHLTLRASREVA
jgi:hypothetical protein